MASRLAATARVVEYFRHTVCRDEIRPEVSVIRCAECDAALPVADGRGRPRRYCSRRCQARAYRRRRDGSARKVPEVPRSSGDDLVSLAVRLADDSGLDAISMRILADCAGLPVHLLYRQVRNRADLLAAMAEHVLTERGPRHLARPRDPRAQLRQLARDEWAMYRRHPWLLMVLATDRPPTGPAVLAMVDRVVAVLAEAGFEPAEAYRVYLVLSGYVQGMALLVGRDPDAASARAWRSATRLRLEHTGRMERRPWLAAAGRTDPDTELDTWFEYGLDRMLAGLLPEVTAR